MRDDAANQMAMANIAKNKAADSIDAEIEKALDEAAEKQRDSIIEQVKIEYELAEAYISAKRKTWGERLKMYNNQRRKKTAVGDPLIFTTHTTILAALYDDKLQSEFLPRRQEDEDVAENLTRLAEFDYDEMEKEYLDHDWDWDTLFFGRGLCLMTDFDRESLTPMPQVLDPMVFLRDPRATSVNGNAKGQGAARFWGYDVLMSKQEMEQHEEIFTTDSLKSDLHSSATSEYQQNKQYRTDAQGLTEQAFGRLTGDNSEFLITEWWTWWEGKPTLVRLANKRSKLVSYKQFDIPARRRGTFGRRFHWPLIDRSIYRMSHDWDGVSIPDLSEEKQRARSVVQNLSLEGIKSGLFKGYVYDESRIKSKADLDFGMNKHVAVKGGVNNVIAPIDRSPVTSDVNWILEVLDTAAQRATATPEIQQGAVAEQKRTLGELNIVERKVDTRFSLSAKLFSASEKRFWRRWYAMYKEHFTDKIDEKVIRFAGEMGASWRPLMRENIVGIVDPDVQVESATVAEAQRLNKLQIFSNYARALDTAPDADRRFMLRFMGKLSGLKTEEINRLLPRNIDEMHAEEENEALNKGKLPTIDIHDDHHAHIIIHSKAKDSKAKQAHIKKHKEAMMMQRNDPTLRPAPDAVLGAGQSEAPDLEAANFAPRAPASAAPQA